MSNWYPLEIIESVNAYAYNIQVCLGKKVGKHPEKGQDKRVVLNLTYGLKDHKVTCDMFFTSYDLGQKQLNRKITMLGAIRKNKPELPIAIVCNINKVLYSKFDSTYNIAVVYYITKRIKFYRVIKIIKIISHS